MGYQLWTSPTTGHRRVGTRIPEIRALFESGITVRAIFERLKSCSSYAPAESVRQLLTERDFDVVGVQDSEGAQITGYVLRESLSDGAVSEHRIPLSTSLLISDSTPLVQVLYVLRERSFVFVLSGAAVVGIVTRADLNKPPVRIYLFGIVSLMEMHMNYWIGCKYKDSWCDHLSAKRLEMAKELHTKRKEQRGNLELFDCIQFADKRDLIVRDGELRQLFDLGEKNEGKRLLRHSENLRNALAHSQDDLTEGADWNEIIDTVRSIEHMLARSDAAIESTALKAAGEFQEQLCHCSLA